MEELMMETVYPVTGAIAENKRKSSSEKAIAKHKKALRLEGF
jgi:hypothetical protein